jgi:hypothetical protein
MMRKSCDFSKAEPNPHVAEFRKGSNIAILDPDVARHFPDSASVNRVLRLVGTLMEQASPRQQKRVRRSTSR